MQESGDNSLMRGLWTMESLLKLNLGPTNQHQEFYNPSAQEKCLRLLELLGHQFKHKIIGLLKQITEARSSTCLYFVNKNNDTVITGGIKLNFINHRSL